MGTSKSKNPRRDWLKEMPLLMLILMCKPDMRGIWSRKKVMPARPIPNLQRLTQIPATNNLPTRDWLKEMPLLTHPHIMVIMVDTMDIILTIIDMAIIMVIYMDSLVHK